MHDCKHPGLRRNLLLIEPWWQQSTAPLNCTRHNDLNFNLSDKTNGHVKINCTVLEYLSLSILVCGGVFCQEVLIYNIYCTFTLRQNCSTILQSGLDKLSCTDSSLSYMNSFRDGDDSQILWSISAYLNFVWEFYANQLYWSRDELRQWSSQAINVIFVLFISQLKMLPVSRIFSFAMAFRFTQCNIFTMFLTIATSRKTYKTK